VIELADVAGPRMIEQRLQRRRLETGDVLPVSLRVLAQEVGGQRRNVLAAFAQRRQLDLDGVQPEQQILAEPSPATSSPRLELVAETMRTFA